MMDILLTTRDLMEEIGGGDFSRMSLVQALIGSEGVWKLVGHLLLGSSNVFRSTITF